LLYRYMLISCDKFISWSIVIRSIAPRPSAKIPPRRRYRQPLSPPPAPSLKLKKQQRKWPGPQRIPGDWKKTLTDKEPTPKLYRMRLFAVNTVVASQDFGTWKWLPRPQESIWWNCLYQRGMS
jgi:hypothetical protein